MLQSRFVWKVFGLMVVSILLTTLAMGSLLGRSIDTSTRAEVRDRLNAAALFLAELSRPALVSGASEGFSRRVADLGERLGIRLTVIGAEGTVLADTGNDPADLDNHGNRPEIVDASKDGSGMAVRHSQTVGTAMMYVARAVRDEAAGLVGFARASMPMKALDDKLAEVRSTLVIGGLLGTLLALLVSFLLTRRITRPLGSMTDTAMAIARGDYERRIDVGGRDEIGLLGRAFNTMAGNLAERVRGMTRDRNKLRTILEGMVEGVVAVDHRERILHMSSVAADLLSANADQSEGRPVWEVTRVHQVSEMLSRILGGETHLQGEVRLVGGGRERRVALTGALLEDGAGRRVGAVVVLHDITELERLERIRSDFVANVSHELKTPITAIRGIAETLVDDPAMAGETRSRFLERIKEQTRRLSDLVVDLLTLARLESEEGHLPREPIDVRGPARAAARAVFPDRDELPVRFEESLPEAVMVLGDGEALEQAVGNLLSNAARYTPAGGIVRLRVVARDGMALVEIEDTGIGIDPVHQRRIFERFYRVDKARSRELGGTGLGLSIVKHVCRAHGGEVSVRSMPGSGSTFTMRIPLAGD